MAINWFKGGRRISALFSGLVLFCGAAYAIFSGGDNTVVLETNSSTDAFHWTLKDCKYPDQSKDWDGTIELKSGGSRTLTACFRVNKNGKIWSGYDPELKSSKGKPPEFKIREMLEVETYSTVADDYMLRRMKGYAIPTSQFDAISRDQWMIAWVNFWNRVKEAAPWVTGLLIGIWLLTTVIGWIIRGFSGIPSGRDFRTERSEHANVEKSSGEWIGAAIALAVIAGGVAWGISAGTSAAAPNIGQLVSKTFGVIGKLISVALFFGATAAGGWGLWVLGHKILRREPSILSEKKLIAACIANAVLVTALSFPANAYSIIGTWVDTVDQWSRSNGYADGGSMAIFSLCLLWPLAPLFIMHKFKEPSLSEPSTLTE